MADPRKWSTTFPLPPHLAALQMLVNRCPSAEARKELIVTAGACEAMSKGHAGV